MRVIAAGLLLLLSAGEVRGDEPIVPARHEVRSPHGTIIAISDPKSGTAVIRAQTGEVLSSLPQWFPWLFISDDGDHMVSTDFNGLIPADYGDRLALLTCWKKGRKVGEVSASEVIPDKTILKQTISHHRWGSIGEVTAENEVVLKRVGG